MAKHRKNLIRLSGLRVPDVGGQHKKPILIPDFERWTLAGNLKT